MRSIKQKIEKLLPYLFLVIALISFYIILLAQNSNRELDKIHNQQPVAPQTTDKPEDKYNFFHRQAEKAINQDNEEDADFWLARYFSWAAINNNSSWALDSITPLLQDYKVSKPTSFISGNYDPEFIHWFVYSTHEMWNFNEANQGLTMQDDDTTFQLAGVKNDKYFAVIFGGRPYLEGWYIISDKPQIAILILGDSNKEKLYLAAGKVAENKGEMAQTDDEVGKVEIDLGGFLQHIWQPELFDLENDGIPEVWVRYNQTTADGFTQELAIYKIKSHGELYLFQKFTGRTEGIARRINNNVEVGEGIAGSAGDGHLNFSEFHFTTYEFKDGSFFKKSEKITPHILLSDKWEEYYEN